MYKRTFSLLALLLLLVGQSIRAQITECKGIVRSAEDNQPIVGALVKVVGTTDGGITDLEGRFYIKNLSSGSSLRLQASSIGYKTQEIPLKAYNEIVMQAENQMLDEVVIVAYGNSSKKALTGAVAQINEKALRSRALTTPLSALEGAAPGVQIANNMGDMNHPGFSMTIRGLGSVNGSSAPLIVLDGLVLEYSDVFSDINPNDIASISVLKDASATALYGNRAANGVVLITTKTGKGDRLSVEANIKQGTYSRGLPGYEKMGVKDWMETYWKATQRSYMVDKNMTAADAAATTTANLVKNMGVNVFDRADAEVFDGNGNLVANMLPSYNDTDWMDAITRNGYRQEYNVSASAATEKYDFYASAGYLSENGYIKTTDMNRTTARLKANFRPNSWFKGGINLSGNVSEGSYLDYSTDGFTSVKNPFVTLERMAPIYSYYAHNEDGSLVLGSDGNPTYNLNQAYLGNRNIIYEMYNNVHKAKRTTLNGDVYGTISFLKDFNFTVRGNLYSFANNKREYQNAVSGEGMNTGILTRSFSNFKQMRFTEELNWAHDFDKHHIDAFLAHEAYKLHLESDNAIKMGQKMDMVFPELSNFNTANTVSGGESEYTTESYLMRARYNYADTYFAEASFRRDGSSRFYNPWGNFWSVGAAWLISNEAFMQPVTAVNSLKLRASYGETGNDEISNTSTNFYPYQAIYGGYTVGYGGFGALTVKQNYNEALTWEKNATFDVAVEARLFNRLNVTLEYYDRQSKNLLFSVFNPLSAGATDIYFASGGTNTGMSVVNRNVGNVSNRGWELAVNADVLTQKDWKWNVGVNLTLPSNKITTLPGHTDIANGIQRFSEGHSIYEFYMTQWAGVDQANGRGVYIADPEQATETNLAKGNIFQLDNGEYYTYNATYGKEDWSGSALPDCYGSISSELNYKDFTLSLLGTWSIGGKIFDSNYAWLALFNTDKYSALHKDLLNAWTAAPAGITEESTSASRIDANGTPRIDISKEAAYFATTSSPSSTRFLVDAGYFCMKNISLQYRVPQSLVQRMGIQGLSFTGSVENAFTLTARKGLNPQYGFSGTQAVTYVPARVFSISANIKF
ncbi:SusC/RagA family TonB-linked outer membrane protein [Bacteroides helcogenes]|uniref:TonB-dependent receptor plug n=1 Tax=Bacteroides helcogenes (strain ATCC 35417 / DSM 20613 / JCM 6297 / CCUG 15421 / P 36-108) TaxID=693979 RepID=E6SUX2_BACT6|nr:SusC/RagA family TonB-linked outer membrane protein [Bacteroides helcogenes]ADV42408.1 TonB-dependent receptor plug [Bacteroides helcogenes P 36-108]MDY5238088.1 SusC/RagA family TonB-linked outer membrane protein [Bacteroides helcogenes]